jgi:hypothetical protein
MSKMWNGMGAVSSTLYHLPAACGKRTECVGVYLRMEHHRAMSHPSAPPTIQNYVHNNGECAGWTHALAITVRGG